MFFFLTFKIDYICDIGCGNGNLSFNLASLGYSNICSIDYSEKAIEFCRAKYRCFPSFIEFRIVDVFIGNIHRRFDVMIDKGTYDSLCLTPDMQIKAIQHYYFKFLTKHFKIGGYFIIYTINHNLEEMLEFLNESQREYDNRFNFKLEHEFLSIRQLNCPGHVIKQIFGLIFSLQIKD